MKISESMVRAGVEKLTELFGKNFSKYYLKGYGRISPYRIATDIFEAMIAAKEKPVKIDTTELADFTHIPCAAYWITWNNATYLDNRRINK